MATRRALVSAIHFIVFLRAVDAGFYDCTEGVECSSTYGSPTVGTEAQMQAACDADAACVALQWNDAQSYGFTCDSTTTDPDPDVKVCVKMPGPPPSQPDPLPPPSP